MPYEWIARPQTAPDQSGAVVVPTAELHLWPYRSLPKRGFVWFIGITVAMISLPLVGLVGSPLLWALLPFPAAAVAGVWWAIDRSYRDGAIREELRLWPDRISLTRHCPDKPVKTWEANPHWVHVGIHPTGGPVEHYVTLRGAGREVEIGAFLSLEERKSLFGDLSDRLRRVRQAGTETIPP
jgi:uncharacterized membrane protein